MAERHSIPSEASDGPAFGPKSVGAVRLVLLLLLTLGFLYSSKDWDLQIYHRYAQFYRESSLERLYAEHTIEYPPLAVLLVLMTDAIAQQLPDCSAFGAVFPEYKHPRPFVNFKLVYRLGMGILVFLTFGLLLRLLERCRPHEGAVERRERLLTFLLSLVILRHAALDRLDMALAALLLLALGLLLSEKSYVWSFGVLAGAIGFKVVPLALTPLWVLGSLPVVLLARRQDAGGWRQLLPVAGGRGVLLAAITLAGFVPFILLGGPGSLAFLSYHRDRGIEYGSTYAALLDVLAALTELKTSTRAGHGSWDVESSLSPLLAFLAPLLVGVLLVAVALLFLATVSRAAIARPGLSDSGTTLAHAFPAEFTGCVILVLLIFLFANKVFSPQFVLWLIPLVPLIPFAGWPRRLFQGGFLGLCLVTAALNPRWMGEVVGKPSPSDPQAFLGPSVFGIALLVSRTLILFGLIVALTVHLLHRLCRRRLFP
jgi:hypothetical protein